MELSLLNEKEKLSLAIQTSDTNVLSQLMGDRTMLVRRAVARNRNTPPNVLDILAFDQSANVVYHAVNNSKCTVNRKITDATHPCVICDKRGDQMNCTNCETLEQFTILNEKAV